MCYLLYRRPYFEKKGKMILLLTLTASNFWINHWLMDVCALILNWLCCMHLCCDMYFLWFHCFYFWFCNLNFLLRDSSCLRRDDSNIFSKTFYSTSYSIFYFISFLFLFFAFTFFSIYFTRLRNQAFSFMEQIVRREFWFLLCSKWGCGVWLCEQQGKTDSTRW